MLLLLAFACTEPPPEMVWPVPVGIDTLVQVKGQKHALADYVRPGLRGEPPGIDEGALTLLWVDVRPDVIATHAGHDAPWRSDVTTDHVSDIFAVRAPAEEMVGLANSLGIVSVPALVAVAPEVEIVVVANVLRSLDRAGCETDLVVALVVGMPEPQVEVMPFRADAAVNCRGTFPHDTTWNEVARSLAKKQECRTFFLEVLPRPPVVSGTSISEQMKPPLELDFLDLFDVDLDALDAPLGVGIGIGAPLDAPLDAP
jgi:hypothetical protein